MKSLSFLLLILLTSSCSEMPFRRTASDDKGNETGNRESTRFPNCFNSYCIGEKVIVKDPREDDNYAKKNPIQGIGVLMYLEIIPEGELSTVKLENGTIVRQYLSSVVQYSKIKNECNTINNEQYCPGEVVLMAERQNGSDYKEKEAKYTKLKILGIADSGEALVTSLDKNGPLYFTNLIYNSTVGFCGAEKIVCVGEEYDNSLGSNDKVLGIGSYYNYKSKSYEDYYLVELGEHLPVKYPRIFYKEQFIKRHEGEYSKKYPFNFSLREVSLLDNDKKLQERIKTEYTNMAYSYCQKEFDGFGTPDFNAEPLPENLLASCSKKITAVEQTDFIPLPRKPRFDLVCNDGIYIVCKHKLFKKK